MTRRYHRQPKHDYSISDKMFAAMPKNLSRTAKCRRISRETGISWGSLYARYFTNKWRHRRERCGMVQTVEPKPINYLHVLEAVKRAITEKTGITDFTTKDGPGQKELGRLAARQNYAPASGYEETNYYAIAE